MLHLFCGGTKSGFYHRRDQRVEQTRGGVGSGELHWPVLTQPMVEWDARIHKMTHGGRLLEIFITGCPFSAFSITCLICVCEKHETQLWSLTFSHLPKSSNKSRHSKMKNIFAEKWCPECKSWRAWRVNLHTAEFILQMEIMTLHVHQQHIFLWWKWEDDELQYLQDGKKLLKTYDLFTWGDVSET